MPKCAIYAHDIDRLVSPNPSSRNGGVLGTKVLPGTPQPEISVGTWVGGCFVRQSVLLKMGWGGGGGGGGRGCVCILSVLSETRDICVPRIIEGPIINCMARFSRNQIGLVHVSPRFVPSLGWVFVAQNI